MDKKIKVVVTLSVEGIHSWADCPIEEVNFLRSPHRHQFVIKAKKYARHEDRDFEIIVLKRQMLAYLASHFGTPCLFGNWSCEMIAGHLCDHFGLCSCEVLEDGENGAEVEL